MARRSKKKRKCRKKDTEKKPVPQYLRDLEVCCPACLSIMVARSSQFGFFFGCSRYPPCRGIRTTENARALAEFDEALEQILLPPLNSEELLFNPDAPSFVWFEVHDLRLIASTATTKALPKHNAGDIEESQETLEESKEFMAKQV